MKIIVALITLLVVSTSVYAADSIGVGIRAGAAANRSSSFTEVFGDLYLNRLVSVGGAVAYTSVDYVNPGVKRDESVPVTAMFKVHAPLTVLKPYAGLGAAMIFHDRRGVKGTPVALVGADLKLGRSPLFLNVEYRRQFDDGLDFVAGGVGVKF